MSSQEEFFDLPLPPSVTSRFIPDVNGLEMHILEAQSSHKNNDSTPALLLLLHGFPELAYSWRKVLVPLCNLGASFHVVAPDQRGYGRTKGWNSQDLDSFRLLNLVTDIVALVHALGYTAVRCVVGHDFGSPIAAYCSLIRPDIFQSVVLMSTPFPGPPSLSRTSALPSLEVLASQLLALEPPRKLYQQYYSPPSTEANWDMMNAAQGISSFLRAYYHMKSADWKENNPNPLSSWSAKELSMMPEYYIMHADKTMSQTVHPHLPPDSWRCLWLTDKELSVYASEFARTSFQGGLNWYQFSTSPQRELRVFAGMTIKVPALFLAGEKDWGMYQAPGALQGMMATACEDMRLDGCATVKNAGHWVQQEQPEEVVRIIGDFLGI